MSSLNIQVDRSKRSRRIREKNFVSPVLGSSQSDVKDNPMKDCRVLAKIPSRWPFNPSYMHTFAVTEHYVVLVEQCLCVSLVQMVQMRITQGPMTDALAWYGNEPVG